MSTKVDNFKTYFDDCSPVFSNFDHHVTLSSCISPSASKRNHNNNVQHSKMPGLLRLDSVGEVSSAKIPADSQIYNRGNSKPVLRNCKSADTDISSKANRSFTKSTMASVKSLTRSPSKFHSGGQHISSTPIFTKAHSFSQGSQPQLGYNKSPSFCGMKTPSVSFDFIQQSSILDKVLSAFSPVRANDYSKLFGSSTCQESSDVSTASQTAADMYIGGVNEGKVTSLLSTVAAALQPTSGRIAPSQSQQFSISDKKNNISSNITDLFELQSREANWHGSVNSAETLYPLAASSPNTKDVESDQSDLSVIFDEKVQVESKLPTLDYALNCENVQQLSQDDFTFSKKETQSCDAFSDRNSSCDDASHSSLKSVIDHLSVLSAPRKNAKKGRPSSKKQKKRQREKRKHEFSPSVCKGFSISSNDTSEVEQNPFASRCPNISLSQMEDSDSSVIFETSNLHLRNFLPRQSSPVKSESKCPIASLFLVSDVEETDDDSDYCDGSSDWSVNEDEAVSVVPAKCSGFNLSLNLDVIFKRKSIPSLKSVLGEEDSESDSENSSVSSAKDCLFNCSQSLTQSTSVDGSFDSSSVGICSPLAAAAAFGFSMGLSLDSIFTKKPSVNCTAEDKITDSKFDAVDGLLSSDNHLSSNVESCLEAISNINAKWNKNYPTAGFRSCQSIKTDEITDSRIKVRFAIGSNLMTIHNVGTEERGGTWHHYALDRERFQRRILDLEKVVSPVLEASHRAKILEQNRRLENCIQTNCL